MLDPLFYPYFGGTEKVVYEVGKRLVRKGYDVEVLTSLIPKAGGVKYEEVEGMKIYRTPCIYLESLPSFMPPPFTICPLFPLEVLKRSKADIFHAHNRFWYYPPTLLLIKFVMRKRLMLTIHNARPKGISPMTDFAGGLYDDTLGRIFFELCDWINCVSKSARDSTIPPHLHHKTSVVYNGVDTRRFDPRKGGGDVREKFGIGDEPLILSNGRLVTQKGFEYLIKAFAKLKRKFGDAKMLIIGRGPLKKNLLSLARSLNVAGSLSITTGIPEDELPHYYNASDVFVLPSLYEPSAVVLYEALSSGKPIVATSVGGNPEIVSRECGFIVPPADSEALRKRMEILISDEKLRKRMGRAARRRARKYFDWDIIAERWDDVYRKVISL